MIGCINRPAAITRTNLELLVYFLLFFSCFVFLFFFFHQVGVSFSKTKMILIFTPQMLMELVELMLFTSVFKMFHFQLPILETEHCIHVTDSFSRK